jgi:hypothetical protein
MKELVNGFSFFGAVMAASAAPFNWMLAAPILLISVLIYCLTNTD